VVHNKYPDIISWHSGSPHSEGVEPDCPIKDGWTMRVIEENGQELFAETVYTHEYWDKGIAKKAHPFSWEEASI